MSSELGNLLRVSVFGESHGPAIGALIDGLPPGFAVDMEELQTFLDRRRPGRDGLSTARKETDRPRFLSGLLDGVTTGTPLLLVMENSDQRSGDYAALRDTPRPGHADYTAYVKYGGFADMRGGGHFSGRLTAPVCAAGGIAKQILARQHGIFIGAHLAAVGGVSDESFPLFPDRETLEAPGRKPFPVLDDAAGERMKAVIEKARREQDSVGGIVECAAVGVPAGWGGPIFAGTEGRLAAALFGIPAVKGVEFGAGFHAAELRGSENNDAFCPSGDSPGTITETNHNPGIITEASHSPGTITETNHSGGILGGITNGMPLVFRAAFKPTPSIARPQRTVNLRTGAAAELVIHGRHDPCVAHRAVPVVEAVASLVLLDMLMEAEGTASAERDTTGGRT